MHDSSTELHDHVDAVASLNVGLGDGLLVLKLLSSIDKLNHGHVDTNSFLKSLLDLVDLVSWLKIELLVGSSESLQKDKSFVLTKEINLP